MLAQAHASTAVSHTVATLARRSPVSLRVVPPSTLDEHLSRAPLRSCAAKEHVFTEGDARTSLYRLESGAVCLYKVMPDGRRQVLGFAYPGDLIGLGSCAEH